MVSSRTNSSMGGPIAVKNPNASTRFHACKSIPGESLARLERIHHALISIVSSRGTTDKIDQLWASSTITLCPRNLTPPVCIVVFRKWNHSRPELYKLVLYQFLQRSNIVYVFDMLRWRSIFTCAEIRHCKSRQSQCVGYYRWPAKVQTNYRF